MRQMATFGARGEANQGHLMVRPIKTNTLPALNFKAPNRSAGHPLSQSRQESPARIAVRHSIRGIPTLMVRMGALFLNRNSAERVPGTCHPAAMAGRGKSPDL